MTIWQVPCDGRYPPGNYPHRSWGEVRPGEFLHASGQESGRFLRLPDGSFADRKETGLTPEDARQCVIGGADIYLTRHGVSVLEDLEQQVWIANRDASEARQTGPVLHGELPNPTIDLYEGPDGQFVVVLIGCWSWSTGGRSILPAIVESSVENR